MSSRRSNTVHASAEVELVDQIAEFYADAYGFVMYAFPWGEAGTHLEGHTGPDTWQRAQLDRVSQRIQEDPLTVIQEAIASGHGIGKSAMTAFIILWAMSTRPHLNGIITANTLNQLTTKTWRELAVWHKRLINEHWFKWTATKFFHVDHPETWFCAAVPNSEHNSEAFAGQHAEHVLVIYDEASAIPDRIWEVSMGAMTTPRSMWFVYGNPTKNTGRFRECFGRYKHRWHTEHIDSRTCKMTDKEQLKQWADDYGEDSDFYKVRVRGEFPSAGDKQFIPVHIAEEAMRREVEVPMGTSRVLGVDVARYGDDMTVIARRHGRKLEPLLKYRGLDTMEVAARVAELIDKDHPDVTFVDGVGIGAGVVDRLKQLGYPVVEVQSGARPDKLMDDKVYNKRAEMWVRMRDWLETADIPYDRDLLADLTGIEYGFDAKQRIQLEKKSDMKKRGLSSPDTADALALTFALPTPPSRLMHSREDLIPEWFDDFV